jgi:hypothetical protein
VTVIADLPVVLETLSKDDRIAAAVARAADHRRRRETRAGHEARSSIAITRTSVVRVSIRSALDFVGAALRQPVQPGTLQVGLPVRSSREESTADRRSWKPMKRLIRWSCLAVVLLGLARPVFALESELVWLNGDLSQYAFCEASNITTADLTDVTLTVKNSDGSVAATSTCATLAAGHTCTTLDSASAEGKRCTITVGGKGKTKSLRAGIVVCAVSFPYACTTVIRAD